MPSGESTEEHRGIPAQSNTEGNVKRSDQVSRRSDEWCLPPVADGWWTKGLDELDARRRIDGGRLLLDLGVGVGVGVGCPWICITMLYDCNKRNWSPTSILSIGLSLNRYTTSHLRSS